MKKTIARSLIALLTAAAGCTGDEATTRCGENTVRRDGQCVSTIPETTCGPGTTRDASGRCVADLGCATGTIYEPVSGECRPEFVCGSGTTLDTTTGKCEPDSRCGPDTIFVHGTCVPTTVCGANTTLDPVTGECKADDRCGPGTSFNPANGTCEPTLVCGPGFTAVDDKCLTPSEVLVAAAEGDPGRVFAESLVDDNDPTLGGTAENVVLRPAGDSVLLTGKIIRPADWDDDGDVDQDRDGWSFVGSAGTYLRIQVLDNGLREPVFALWGPNGYYRSSEVKPSPSADRKLVLPYDGPYKLLITWLGDRYGLPPLGASEENYVAQGYVASIEVLPWPTATTGLNIVTPGAMDAPAQGTGSVRALASNFFSIDGDLGEALFFDFIAGAAGSRPQLVAFRNDGSLVYDVPMTAGANDTKARFSAFLEDDGAGADRGFVIAVDWTTSDGDEVDYTLSVASKPIEPMATIATDVTFIGPTASVAVDDGAAFTFEAPPEQIVTLVLSAKSSTDDLTFYGPSGPLSFDMPTLGSTSQYFVYSGDGGTYRFAYRNSVGADNLLIYVRTQTPYDGGSFDGASGQVVVNGPDLEHRVIIDDQAWILADVTAPGRLIWDPDFRSGYTVAELYRLGADGVAISDKLVSYKRGMRVSQLFATPGRTLLRLASPTAGTYPKPALRGWSVRIDGGPLPIANEVEPNDDIAAQVASLPATIVGSVVDADKDLYQLTLDSALAANEVVRVSVESFSDFDNLTLKISTAEPKTYTAPGDSYTSGWYLLPADVGPFVLEVSGAAGKAIDYELRIERLTVGATDVSAKSSALSADSNRITVGATGFVVHGLAPKTLTGSAQGEFYAFELAPSLQDGVLVRVDREHGSTSSSNIRVRLHVAEGGGTYTELVEILDASLASSNPSEAFYVHAGPEPIIMEVSHILQDGTPYRIRIDALPEADSGENTTAVNPHVVTLGDTQPVTVYGFAPSGALRYYRAALDPPLAAGEALSVRWSNDTEDNAVMAEASWDDGTPRTALSRRFAGLITAGSAGEDEINLVIKPQATSGTRPAHYRLVMQRVNAWAELEPNDATTEATELGDLPAVARGQDVKDPDVDVFRVTLPRDLVAGETIEVSARALDSAYKLTLRVLDDSATPVELGASTSSLWPSLSIAPPVTTAGAVYYVEVNSEASFTDIAGAYEVAIELGAP